MRFNALRTLAATREGAALSREALITKLYWATWHRALGKLAMDVLGPEAEIAEGAPVRARRAAAAVPLHARRHDLRRHQPDPAQHHRRARARPAARAAAEPERCSADRAPPCPARPRAARRQDRARHRRRRHRHRLRDREALRRGRRARDAVSDQHERRLGEAAEQLETLDRRRRPLTALRRHARGRSASAVRARDRRARAASTCS